ncbi:MAG TPA: amidohydrolase family protein [Armatimonadota bacterium]|nr:amidohydrolase family protein [Armatimonadota bacterium]
MCDTREVVMVEAPADRISRVAAIPESGPVEPPDVGSPDVWLSPGFLDLQVNGYGGADFNVGAWGGAEEVTTAVAPVYEHLARGGTPLLCPTITTNSREAILTAFRGLAAALDSDRMLDQRTPGFHLEGPYISSEEGPRGAHPLEHVRDPDWDEFQQFQEAAGGRIRICTVAPEREGALRFIERASNAGVVVALGHTGAEPSTIRDAKLAGAQLSTHLGNGAHGLIRRHPNYIWEQLADDRLFAGVIADGHHLPPSVLKVFARAKGAERLALVSDAVSLGGLPPGRYAGGRFEVLETGKIVLAGTAYLAGAGRLLDTGVANALRFTDLTLREATRCASAIPARILGLENRKGRIQPGFDADFTLFRVPDGGPLEIVASICAGQVLYRGAAA